MNDVLQPTQPPAEPQPPTLPTPTAAAEWVTAAAALEGLRSALVQAGAAAKLQWLQVDYEGFADDGGPQACHCEPPMELDDLPVDAPAFLPRWLPELGMRYEAVAMPRSMATVLEELLDLGLGMTGHAGYETGDGGHGHLLLDMGSGALTIEHYDHFVQEEESFHTLSEGDAPAVQPEPGIGLGTPAGAPDPVLTVATKGVGDEH